MDDLQIPSQIVEAIFIASDAPVTQERLNEALDDELKIDLQEVVDYLNQIYLETHRSFFIMKVAGGFQIATHRDYEDFIRRYINRSGRIRLSNAALETLAIIAYKQPVSRPEIEQIRGVNSDGVINTLMERELITVKGRADAPGRPLLLTTTDEFLRYFGLNSAADLPRLKELETMFDDEADVRYDTTENEGTNETE